MYTTPCGYLAVRVGTMRSGKTDWLRSNATRFADLKEKVMYINSTKDDPKTRKTAGGDGKNYTSHSSSSVKFSDNVEMVRKDFLYHIDVSDIDVICIDEAQFFPDLVETVLRWLLVENKHILISSLDGSYLQNPIGDIYKLCPYASEFIKMSATCKLCIKEHKDKNLPVKTKHNDAPHTILLNRMKDSDLEEIKPGRTDDFYSVCTYHYKEHLKSDPDQYMVKYAEIADDLLESIIYA